MEDLRASGDLSQTLIVMMGEFGRTPGVLNSRAGRDHYRPVMSVAMLGGGVRGGRVIGASDATGAAITDPGLERQSGHLSGGHRVDYLLGDGNRLDQDDRRHPFEPPLLLRQRRRRRRLPPRGGGLCLTCGLCVGLLAASACAQTPALVHILSDDSQVLVGRTLQMRAVVRDAAGNPIPNAAVTWTINQSQAGSISTSGLVTARGLATIRVTARSGSVTGEAAIQSIPSRVEVTPPSAELEIGSRMQFRATAYDADGAPIAGVPFTWSLTNSARAPHRSPHRQHRHGDGDGRRRSLGLGNLYL